MNSLHIIESLEKGEINAERALSLFTESPQEKNIKRGRFFKIKVNDKKTNINIMIPIFLINTSLLLVRLASKFVKEDNISQDAAISLKALQSLDKEDINTLIKELKMCKSLNMVEVQTNDTHISISIV